MISINLVGIPLISFSFPLSFIINYDTKIKRKENQERVTGTHKKKRRRRWKLRERSATTGAGAADERQENISIRYTSIRKTFSPPPLPIIDRVNRKKKPFTIISNE